jgi:hypothetical protein
MNLHDIAVTYSWAFILIVGAIILTACAIFGFAFYISVNWAIDRYQERKRRPMATPQNRDEIMLRRLKKSVAVRVSQRDMANSK